MPVSKRKLYGKIYYLKQFIRSEYFSSLEESSVYTALKLV